MSLLHGENAGSIPAESTDMLVAWWSGTSDGRLGELSAPTASWRPAFRRALYTGENNNTKSFEFMQQVDKSRWINGADKVSGESSDNPQRESNVTDE